MWYFACAMRACAADCSLAVQGSLEAALERSCANVLKAAGNKTVLLCIDDLHVCTTGAASDTMSEFLRSLVSRRGFNNANGSCTQVQGLQLLVSADPCHLSQCASVKRLRCRLATVQVATTAQAGAVYSQPDRRAIGDVCTAFVSSIRNSVQLRPDALLDSALAAVVSLLVKEALEEGGAQLDDSRHRAFDLEAIRRILCRVRADIAEEPLGFAADADRRSAIKGTLHGGSLLRMFGKLAEEQTRDSLHSNEPRQAPAEQVCSIHARTPRACLDQLGAP